VATLVFSTIGTALGGPVGSAIGALVGQSIDQQLLAPVRRGPRVGDLAVQSSSYGTQVPRVYGMMRVAGSVIWSTDLIENEAAGGAKGQPDLTYSYTVSMAVAVSSRPIKSIKRIWADGKLIRGAAGDFKIGTKFRVYDGGEDQDADPLIASSEGICMTPAYRGLAICVFEDLELAAFGNRIPFFTFEIEADEGPVAIADLLEDASGQLIRCNDQRTLEGYAAYGRSMRDAVEPLVSAFAVDLFDDGEGLSSPPPLEIPIGSDELGNSADGKAAARFARGQMASQAMPSSLRLTHYDPVRDYQSGEARSSIGTVGEDVQHDLPAVLSADQAKGLANAMLARAWTTRDRLTLRLPVSRMNCPPGAILAVPFMPVRWQVRKSTNDGFVTVVELRPGFARVGALMADPGRVANNPDAVIGPIALALFDVPDPMSIANEPAILLAATSTGDGWKARAVDLRIGDQQKVTPTARGKSVLGHALASLADGTPFLIDERGCVDVQLIDRDQWLLSCDDEALASGANAAVLGRELIQFGRAEPLGNGQFRLSRLLRGRGGTEWASSIHEAGEPFCLLRAGTVQKLTMPAPTLGATVEAGIGESSVSAIFKGECVRPLTPVRLQAESQSDGSLLLHWIRRSRAGFGWVDGVDAPLGETREQYRVVLASETQSFEFSSTEPCIVIGQASIATLGAGIIRASVQQVGDFAASRPTTIIVN
jgi:hypothetical protein